MKKAIILSAALILLGSHGLFGQQYLFNGCSSAGNLALPVQFNCDFSGGTGVGLNLNYKGQSDPDFNRLSLNPIDESPYYDLTYQASVSFPVSPGMLEYYFDAVRDSFMITQSPKNAANQFPPPTYKYADFISDPQGDMANGSAGNWLDLTDNGMTYSDTRLYCYLRNVSGTWPLNQSLTYFVYTFGFLITSGTDSAYYALVYANVPLLLSTGLYSLDLSDSSFTRLGNISNTISNGTLHMACDLSVFSADPNWPGWPPPEGYIIPMGATLTASLSGQFANDLTYLPIYEPQTYYLNFDSNNPPVLTSSIIEADSGVSITPWITYLDSDNNLPTVRSFHFDSDSYDLASYDHHYSDSSRFETGLAWPGDGWHHFYFEFSDGGETVRTPLDSVRVGAPRCDYVVGDANGNGSFNGLDVTYGVAYFKGGPPPLYQCECTPGHTWYVSGDVNQSCNFNGLDVTYMVSYFKGGPPPSPCPDCPPGK
jgi:hypothetical protein